MVVQAGILILVVPRLLNCIVAIYLIISSGTPFAGDHCLNFSTTRPSRNLTTQAFDSGQTV